MQCKAHLPFRYAEAAGSGGGITSSQLEGFDQKLTLQSCQSGIEG
jgi:hypothetical protein